MAFAFSTVLDRICFVAVEAVAYLFVELVYCLFRVGGWKRKSLHVDLLGVVVLGIFVLISLNLWQG